MKSNQETRQIKQVLDFPCCNKHSWADLTIEMGRVNYFLITCKQCRSVHRLEIRPKRPVKDNGYVIQHPVKWYPETSYGTSPCSAIPHRVVTEYKP